MVLTVDLLNLNAIVAEMQLIFPQKIYVKVYKNRSINEGALSEDKLILILKLTENPTITPLNSRVKTVSVTFTRAWRERTCCQGV